MDILQHGDDILSQKAKVVPLEEISSDKIKAVIKNMSKSMHSQKDGVAIAAPQIGESLRIFVVDGDLLTKADPSYKGEDKDLVFINPTITKYSKEKTDMEEGCLSVRWLYGIVKRSTRVSLEAYNEKGAKITRGASGVLAQIFQHECDHLDGTLFIEKTDEIWELSPEEIAELQGK